MIEAQSNQRLSGLLRIRLPSLRSVLVAPLTPSLSPLGRGSRVLFHQLGYDLRAKVLDRMFTHLAFAK